MYRLAAMLFIILGTSTTGCADEPEILSHVCLTEASPMVQFMVENRASEMDSVLRLEFSGLVEKAYQACRPEEVVWLRNRVVNSWLQGQPPGELRVS